jgi:hypothetical protein
MRWGLECSRNLLPLERQSPGLFYKDSAMKMPSKMPMKMPTAKKSGGKSKGKGGGKKC